MARRQLPMDEKIRIAHWQDGLLRRIGKKTRKLIEELHDGTQATLDELLRAYRGEGAPPWYCAAVRIIWHRTTESKAQG